MRTRNTLFAAALVATASITATAADLKPMQAYTVDLGEQTAVVYYTEVNGQFEVVTTVATNDGSGVPTRYVTTLEPGQASTVSIANARQTVLTVSRHANTVLMESSDDQQIADASNYLNPK